MDYVIEGQTYNVSAFFSEVPAELFQEFKGEIISTILNSSSGTDITEIPRGDDTFPLFDGSIRIVSNSNTSLDQWNAAADPDDSNKIIINATDAN